MRETSPCRRTGNPLTFWSKGVPGDPTDIQRSFIVVYALDPITGAPAVKQELATGAPNFQGPSNITVHPSGKFIYLSNYYESQSQQRRIAILAVQPTGHFSSPEWSDRYNHRQVTAR